MNTRVSTCLILASLGSIPHQAGGEMTSTPSRKASTRDAVGLALAGGSLTAANIGGSIMRGFQMQRVKIDGEERPAMEAFDYVSGLSGGNYPSLMYAFARDVDSDELLDADGISDPADITAESLESMPPRSMFATFAMSVLPNFLKALAWTMTVAPESPFWAVFVYLHFLEPIGIPPDVRVGGSGKEPGEYVVPRSGVKATPVVEFSMVGPPELYPDWLYERSSQGTAAGLNESYPTVPKHDVPPYGEMHAWNNTFVMEHVAQSGYQIPVPFFSTPDEVHCPFLKCEMRFDPVLDGTTAEPLDFFGPFVLSAEDVSPESVGLFSLEKLMALGTALVPILGKYGLFPDFFLDLIDKPLLLDVPTAGGGGETRTMAFADGGYNDGSGIPALVSLKVRRIISVQLVTPGGFFNDPQYIAYAPSGFLGWASAYIQPFFGVIDPNRLDPDSFNVAGSFVNHLFDLNSNGENQLVKFNTIMSAQLEAGNPLIATLNDLEVVKNEFWGTEAGERVDLTTIFVLGVPEKFSDRVPRDAAPPPEGRNFTEHGFFTNEDLRLVPNVLNVRNLAIKEDIKDEDGNVVFSIDEEFEVPMEYGLYTRETRMTNFLCSWMVGEAWEGLEDVNGETTFEGFKRIFESSLPGGDDSGATTTTPEDAGEDSGATTPPPEDAEDDSSVTTQNGGEDSSVTTAKDGNEGSTTTPPEDATASSAHSIFVLFAFGSAAMTGVATCILFM